jgi:ParB-like chromosome segregation protein Spo0J
MSGLPNIDPIAVGDEVSSKMIAVDSIGVPPERMRKLRYELVDKLAESIEKEGLLQPIIVRPLPDCRGYVLIAGHHRLEAVRKLKHDTIRAEILEGLSADQARVAEIDENLIRADLTPSERAVHHAERKALYLKLHPETKHGGAPGKAGGGKKAKDAKLASFVKDTAKKTGKAKRTIARDVSRGEKIDPQALADLAGTCLDNGTELDALAKLPAAEQRSLAEAAKRGEKVSAISARNACGPEAPKTSDGTGKARSRPSRRKKADLAPTLDPRAWSMSTPQEREAFVETVGRSEFEDALNAIESGCKLTRSLNSEPENLLMKARQDTARFCCGV